jgi:alpha-aminoadipic semialdehyde synthase
MSLTVGVPTAIGAQLILDNKISERGVIRPVYADIYNPTIKLLEEIGIKLVEVDEDL